jgi:hypothetical protein
MNDLREAVKKYNEAAQALKDAENKLTEVVQPLYTKVLDDKDGIIELINLLPTNYIDLRKMYRRLVQLH